MKATMNMIVTMNQSVLRRNIALLFIFLWVFNIDVFGQCVDNATADACIVINSIAAPPFCNNTQITANLSENDHTNFESLYALDFDNDGIIDSVSMTNNGAFHLLTGTGSTCNISPKLFGFNYDTTPTNAFTPPKIGESTTAFVSICRTLTQDCAVDSMVIPLIDSVNIEGLATVTVNCDADTSLSITHLTTVFGLTIEGCRINTIDFVDEQVEGECLKRIARRWRVADNCGNEDSFLQAITFQDTVPPIITPPSNVELFCGQDTSITQLGMATVMDACNTQGIVLRHEDIYTENSCPIQIIRRWYAEDICGNIDSVDQVITITDIINPDVAGPGSLTLSCDSAAVETPSSFGITSDDCDPNLVYNFRDIDSTGTACDLMVMRKWFVEDGCGNIDSSLTQTITFTDTSKPVFSFEPMDTIVNCNADTAATALGMIAEATDNCDSSPEVYYEDVESTGTCPVVITRRWYAVDNCMNIDSVNQMITIQDTLAPVLNCPSTIDIPGVSTSVVVDSTSLAYSETNITISAIQLATAGGSVAEACGVASLAYFDAMTGQCPIIVTRTFIAIDSCGNRDSCEQTINIVSSNKPQITLDTCSADLSTYSIFISVGTSDTLSVDKGTVGNRVADSFLVSGIPNDSTISITVGNIISGCITDTTFTHNCNCPTLAAPRLPNDTTLCTGDTIPPIMAVADTNQIVLWFTSNTLTTPVDTGFTFTVTGPGSIFARGLDTISNCVTAVDTFILSTNGTPILLIEDTTCTTNLDTLSIQVSLFDNLHDTLGTNLGTISSTNNSRYLIRNIPSDTMLIVAAVDTVSGCTDTFTYNINCNCLAILDPPIAAMDTLTVCPGTNATFSVSVDSTQTADWYNAADSLVEMGDTLFTTNVAGAYYAVTRDTIGCPSIDSARVLLQNHALPMPDTFYNNQSPYCITDTIRLIGDSLNNVVYAWTSNGTAMFNDTTLQAPAITGAGDGEIFTVMLTDTLTGCANSLPDTVQLDSLPEITAIAATCDASLDSYSVQIFTDATRLTIRSANGALAPGTNPYTIVGIPADSSLLLTLEIGTTNCAMDTLIAPPSCDCPLLNAPTVMDTVFFCLGDELPTLVAQVDSSETVDWYSTSDASGTPLLVGDTLYTPTMVEPHYALTRDTISGCISDATARIVVMPTVLPSFQTAASISICEGDSVALLATNIVGATTWSWTATGNAIIADPTATMTKAGGVTDGEQFILQGIDARGCESIDTTNTVEVLSATEPDTIYAECTPDLNNYLVYIITNTGTVTASAGTRVNISTDTIQIRDLPTTTDVTITLTDENNCVYNQLVTAPNCSCPQNLPAPIISDLTICQEDTPLLQAEVGQGETVNWFDTIVGGIPLTVSPNFTSPETMAGTYTYYAQTVNSVNGCVSLPRTPVTLTILPLPNPNLPAVRTICSGTTTILTPGLFSSYFWSTGDTTATISVGVGQYFVTVTDGNGCTAVQTATVEQNTGQAVTLDFPDMACTSDNAFTLAGGNPIGGTYAGPGVANGVFDPIAAGVGRHIITYSIDGDCNQVATDSITVMAPGTIDFSLPSTNFCESDDAILLTGTPIGGIYEGAGISNNTFDPAVAGSGTHALIYTVGTGTSCEIADTIMVMVTATPTVSFSPALTMLCNVTMPFALTGGEPTGGTYSGPGVSDNIFDPVAAGAGVHDITYAIISGDCTISTTESITVTFATATNLSLTKTIFCETDGSIILDGTPTGGVYTGPGVTDNVFDPALAGIGTHELIYATGEGIDCGVSDTVTVRVTAIPTATFNNVTVCTSSGPMTLTGGSPAGGTYSGIGVSNGVFDPAIAGLGTHTLTYTLASGECTAMASAIYEVVTQPTTSLSLATNSVCDNGGSVTLSGGSPEGGTYSGTNVTNGQFDPTGLGAGPYTITYTYSLGENCSSSATATIMVLPSDSGVSFSLGNIQLCENNGLYTLGGGSPAGGTYSGPGVVGNTFNPTTAGPGTHTIIYTGGSSSCFGTATSTITVIDASISTSLDLAIPPQCTNSSALTLGGGSPAGGTYSGAGVAANGQFDPSIAGVGVHTITYSSGCGSATDQIEVQAELPVNLVLAKNSACSNEGSFVLTEGNPAGGTFSGEGVSGNSFAPASVGPGTYTITYTVNPESGCMGSASATIIVTDPAIITPSFTLNVSDLCASSEPFTLSGGSPEGGTYSGPGVVGNVFDPSQAGAGIHTITYALAGCTSGTTTTSIIIENAPPLPEFRMSAEVCEGEELRLEASAVPNVTSYIWSGPNGFSATTSNPVIPNVSLADAGRYNLMIMVGNCASAMNSIDVTVNTLPQAVAVRNSGPVCLGSDFTLEVNNPTNTDLYNWFFENGASIGTGATLELSTDDYQSGRYYVTVSRGSCEYNPIADFNAPDFAFTDLIISSETTVGAFAGPDETVCTSTYDLNPLVPTDPSIFGSWSTPAGSSAIIADASQFNSPVFNLSPGDNIFIWSLSNEGCTGLSSDTVIVNYPAEPTLNNDNFNTNFGEPTVFNPLENDQFSSGYFLDTVFTSENGTAVINGDGTISYAPNNTFAGTDQLSYVVCSSTCPTVCDTALIGIDIIVNTNVEDIILPNTITPNGDGMNDALIIPEVIEYPGSELIVFNRWGDEVYRSVDYQNDWTGFWVENQGLLPIGTYFYIINLNDTNSTRLSGYVYIQRD